MERVAIRPLILARGGASSQITCLQQRFSRSCSTLQQRVLLSKFSSPNVQRGGNSLKILRNDASRILYPIPCRQNLKSAISDHVGRAYARRYSSIAEAATSEPSSEPALAPPSLDDAYIDTKIMARAPIELSAEQRFLLTKVIEEGKSVFFTGSAGTGKSVLLRQLIQELKAVYSPGQVAVTASTGIAACNIGGCTLHAFAGVGLAKGSVEQLMTKLESNRKAKSRWKKAKVLIIDESKLIR